MHQLDGMKDCGGVYVACTASIIRDVTIGKDSSIWFGAVLRGDDAPITLGRRVNIQDMTMIHADPGKPLVVEDDVTVGHRAILHCLRIGRGTLIGMGAILMEDVEIGEECLVAAGAVVSPGKKIPPRSLVRGVPGQVVRALTPEEVKANYASVAHYITVARQRCGLA